jgi:anthraniloyl-CoA monooxygenase
MRFPLEVATAVRAAIPRGVPLLARVSATDWLEPEGMTLDHAVEVARALAARGVDLIDVSTAGNVPRSAPRYGRMYQVPFADRIRFEAKVPVMAVGGILNPDHANTVLASGRADLVAIGRAHLRDPYLVFHAAEASGHHGLEWPVQYASVRVQSRAPAT